MKGSFAAPTAARAGRRSPGPRTPSRIAVAPGALYVTEPRTRRSLAKHRRGAVRIDVTAGMTTTWTAALALAPGGRTLYAGTTAYGRESGGGVFTRRVR